MSDFLTPEGRVKIEEDLFELKQKRPEIAKRIQNAKEMGDMSENAEYTIAKDEQAWVESEIVRLENLLKSAEVIDQSRVSSRVKIGSKVELSNLGIKTKIKYIIVGSEEADPSEGRISYQSPLGRALINKKINDQVSVETPGGVTNFVIIRIE